MNLGAVYHDPGGAATLKTTSNAPIFQESAAQKLMRWVRAEQRDAVLWLPVFLGLGIALYFSLNTEPALWQALTALALCTAAWGLVRWVWTPLALPMLAVCLIAAGVSLAAFRADTVSAPVFTGELVRAQVEGRLLSIEEGQGRQRLIIAPSRIEGVAPDNMPQKIRLTWRGQRYDGMPGDIIRVRAVVSAPPQPVAPGAYDFARQLYFERIGAVGYAVAAPRAISLPDKSFDTRIEALRLAIGARIMAASEGRNDAARAIAVALVTGKREAIPDAAETALRDAGLAHLLAISGLHMGLAGGLFFFVSRFVFASFPYLALHYPIKKWAAVIALFGAGGYLLISGGAWSSVRAFIMLAVMFVAILLDRRAISLRNVALAALIILILSPEALLQAGFQMSFAAVTVLISAYEWYRRQEAEKNNAYRANSFIDKSKRYLSGIALTSFLAGLATGPFGLYHFNRMTIYGLAGNLLAMPLVGAVIMPAAIAGMLLMPLGMDGLFWQIMVLGIEWVLGSAHFVASWPGAALHVADMGQVAFGLILAGGLILCLLKTPLRHTGLVFLLAASFTSAFERPADVIIGRDARNLAFRVIYEGEAQLALLHRSRARFAAEHWLAAAGQDDDTDNAISLSMLEEETYRCRADSCHITLAKGQVVALSTNMTSLRADCVAADVIIAQYDLTGINIGDCAALILDRAMVHREGAVALRFDARDGFRLASNRQHRGARPWVIAPSDS